MRSGVIKERRERNMKRRVGFLFSVIVIIFAVGCAGTPASEEPARYVSEDGDFSFIPIGEVQSSRGNIGSADKPVMLTTWQCGEDGDPFFVQRTGFNEEMAAGLKMSYDDVLTEVFAGYAGSLSAVEQKKDFVTYQGQRALKFMVAGTVDGGVEIKSSGYIFSYKGMLYIVHATGLEMANGENGRAMLQSFRLLL